MLKRLVPNKDQPYFNAIISFVKLQNTYENLIKITTKQQREKIKVYVGISGGVDSGLTAYKLKNEGFNVIGVYMLCFQSNDPKCRSKKDRADAVKVADFLRVPFEVWDLQKEYKQKVIDYFFEGYKKGLTPNPDILCNSQIKFGVFLQKALELGADFVATGHYAQILDLENLKFETLGPKHKVLDLIEHNVELPQPNNTSRHCEQGKIEQGISDTHFIASGVDSSKDQSYFLCDVDPNVYNKILFPLGTTLKASNRKQANKISLPVATKKDSTGICFLEGINPQDFLKTELKEKLGSVVNKNGEKIGTHKGISFYTIGQRHGFNITKYTGKPGYVIKKDAKTNRLVVGEKKDLLVKEFSIFNFQFSIKPETLRDLVKDKKTFVRIRNLGEFNKIQELKIEKSQVTITTKKPLSSVAPGQFGVIYAKIGKAKIIVGHGEII